MVNRIFTNDNYNEFAGLSTDEKPTRFIGVGSIFVEADTGTVFFFDGSNWVEQFSFQSGGGAKSAVLTKSAPAEEPEVPEEEPDER